MTQQLSLCAAPVHAIDLPIPLIPLTYQQQSWFRPENPKCCMCCCIITTLCVLSPTSSSLFISHRPSSLQRTSTGPTLNVKSVS